MEQEIFDDGSMVSVQDVRERLHVSTNFIYQRIRPFVRHTKVNGHFRMYLYDLRLWLKNNSTFQRQTMFVISDKEEAHLAKLKSLGIVLEDILSIMNPTRRSLLPFRKVEPFDFWDKKLVFATDGKYSQTELCYRDMFQKGAIKISLGGHKALFYVPPEPITRCRLLPAVDEGDAEGEGEGSVQSLERICTITGDNALQWMICTALRHHIGKLGPSAPQLLITPAKGDLHATQIKLVEKVQAASSNVNKVDTQENKDKTQNFTDLIDEIPF